ncbi:IS3 family transposase, partial [Mycobacterium kansasii]
LNVQNNSEIFKSISYRYKFLVGARDPIKDFTLAKHEVFWYIKSFYNQNRIHQGLNYLTPNEFENKQQKLAA